MKEYHVATSKSSGTIYAGIVNDAGDKWEEQTDVTKEALESVRDHLAFVAANNNLEEGVCYRWGKDDGSAIMLKLEFENAKDAKEGENSDGK